MDNQIGILHLSDIHAQNSSRTIISKLTELLINGLTQIQPKHNIVIKAVCISGDLINSGDKSDMELLTRQ